MRASACLHDVLDLVHNWSAVPSIRIGWCPGCRGATICQGYAEDRRNSLRRVGMRGCGYGVVRM